LTGSVRLVSECDLEDFLARNLPLKTWMNGAWSDTILYLAEVRMDGHSWIVRFEGYEERESTDALRNAFLVVNRADLPIPEPGMQYVTDLIDAEIATRDGRVLGRIVGFYDSPAHAIAEIRTEKGTEFLIPFSEEVDAEYVPASNSSGSPRILVNLPEGMEEATTVDPSVLAAEEEHRKRPSLRRRPSSGKA
jgi:16S rRNA processing protein RimM